MEEKVLVVDDEKSIRMAFKRILSDEGYCVDIASSYDEAISLLNSNGYFAIVADILLGCKTGIDLLRELRARNLHVPIIMITGYPNIDTASESVRLGAADYLTKPVRKKQLISAVVSAIEKFKDDKNRSKDQELLSSIFSKSMDGLIAINNHGKIIKINNAAIDICRLRGDLLGKTLKEVCHRCEAGCFKYIEKAIYSNFKVNGEHHYCFYAERLRQVVSLNCFPIINKLDEIVGAILEIKLIQSSSENTKEDQVSYHFHNIVGISEPMIRLYSEINDLANIATTVLIVGESGTGKELIAEALHYMGERKGRPLIKFNCAALPDNLIESELFGHVKGSFTGAVKDRVGRLELAGDGTIFLDEIGDISPNMQLRLLRVLQEKEYERVGSSVSKKVKARIVAATNKDLLAKVKEGEFREDLYYRLNIFPLNVPPLRDRKEDIPLLVTHFIRGFKKKFNKKIDGITDDVLQRFKEYQWPGNVRELQHVLEYCCIRSRQNIIGVENLPRKFKNNEINKKDLNVTGESHNADLITGGVTEGDDRSEYLQILSALEKSDFNKSKAAILLGVDRKTLFRRMQKNKFFNEKKGQ